MRAEGNWELCYQVQKPKALPTRELNAPLCIRTKAKDSLLMLQGFTWEFSNCWLQMNCSPRMAESQMQEFKKPMITHSCSSTCRLQLHLYQTATWDWKRNQEINPHLKRCSSRREHHSLSAGFWTIITRRYQNCTLCCLHLWACCLLGKSEQKCYILCFQCHPNGLRGGSCEQIYRSFFF